MKTRLLAVALPVLARHPLFAQTVTTGDGWEGLTGVAYQGGDAKQPRRPRIAESRAV